MSYSGTGDKADLGNHSNQLNPNNTAYGGGTTSYTGSGTRADLSNHANQLNPNNSRYQEPKGAKRGSDSHPFAWWCNHESFTLMAETDIWSEKVVESEVPFSEQEEHSEIQHKSVNVPSESAVRQSTASPLPSQYEADLDYATAALTAIDILGVQFTIAQVVTLSSPGFSGILDWSQHGLKIHVAPGTLAETETKCSFALGVTCNMQESFVFPPNVTPASPIYYIKPSAKLLKPVMLEIEHCCALKSENDTRGLVAMLAYTTSQRPPYTFEYLEEGKFTVEKIRGPKFQSLPSLYIL